ncbi:MAG TPA: hypothetical protein VEI25_18755 [Paraburkholderia sp.]|nr:hypothetical protein [Paraburkholderia sp.]
MSALFWAQRRPSGWLRRSHRRMSGALREPIAWPEVEWALHC